MNSFRTEPIVLSGEQFMKFADSLRRPNKEYMDRRDAIFEKMDEEISIEREGMDIEVEIPNLDLSFIDEMHSNAGNVCSSTIELSGEVSYIVNDDYAQKVLNAMVESVASVVLDCSDNMSHINLEQLVYNQVGVDKPLTYVKEKSDAKMMQPCKTGQIAYAA